MTAGKERPSEGTAVEPVSRARHTWALVGGAVLFVVAVALVLLPVGVPLPGISGEALAWRTGAGLAVSAAAFGLAGWASTGWLAPASTTPAPERW